LNDSDLETESEAEEVGGKIKNKFGQMKKVLGK
jgi:hypothetical protein